MLNVQTDPPDPTPHPPVPVTIPFVTETQVGETEVEPLDPFTVNDPTLKARVPDPFLGEMAMFPVVSPPKVRV